MTYVAVGTVQDLPETGERSEVLATPAETGDRYRLRLSLGSRAKGPERHVHPGLVEAFVVRNGTVGFRLGRETCLLGSGEGREVPPGTVHGLWNAGDEPAEIDVDVIFTPPGPGPGADLVWFGERYGMLSQQGRPGLLQVAALLDEYAEAFALSVTDTGIGMDDETRAHLFEPFFTTKEVGKGTGLGLATVYGIVKQSGGHVWVYSEPDHGTVFKIYLPRLDAPAAQPTESPRAEPGSRGTETVMVVEDDPAVRHFVQIVLERRGYRVIAAASGAEALQSITSGIESIDLLITDVVMPGMSGFELAKRAAALVPGVKVLFASGYTENTIVHHGSLDTGAPFLQKPFAPGQLADRVRAELDS